jgi:hypothetical protein
VAVGLDVVPGAFHAALLVEEEGGAQDADRGAAVASLLAPGAPGVHDGVVGVGEEGEPQPVLVAEALVAGRVVGGDADHRHPGGLEGGQILVELAGLLGAHSVVVFIDRLTACSSSACLQWPSSGSRTAVTIRGERTSVL